MQITREKTPHCIECLGLTARFRPGNDEKFSCNLQTGRSNSLGSSLFHVADAAHFMCASLTRVPARASALLFSLSFSLTHSRSLSCIPSPRSSPLSRLHPCRAHHPLHPVFSSRTSSFFHAGLRVCVVQSPWKVFVWRFRRGRLFSRCNSFLPLSPLSHALPSSAVDLSARTSGGMNS